MPYGRVIGAGMLAGLLAACAAQNGNSTGPIPYGGTPPTSVSTVDPSEVGNNNSALQSTTFPNSATQQAAAVVGTQAAATSAVGYQGTVAGLGAGGSFTLSTTAGK